MSADEKIERLRSILERIKALVADLNYWSKDANKIADVQEALDEINATLESTA